MALYKAFISYTHRTDEALASAVQSALQEFAKRWYQSRAFRIFRDKTSLSANPALWPAIERALEDSEYFLLVASPEAQRSAWVEKEVGWWLEHRSIDTVVIILSEGELHWNNTTGDFDSDKTTCLPRNLKGQYRHEPQYVDLRWARTNSDLSLRQSQFRAAILDIAAPLHNKPKHELDGVDVRQRRQLQSGIGLLVVLTVLVVVVSVLGYRTANEKTRQQEIALARQLAAESERIRTQGEGLPLSLLLATEAMRRVRSVDSVSLEADQALHLALAKSPRLLVEMGEGDVIAFDQDGKKILASCKDRVRVFDSITGVETSSFAHETDASGLAFSHGGRFLATQRRGHPIRLWDTATSNEVAQIPEDRMGSARVSSDGRFVVTFGGVFDVSAMRLWEISPGNAPRMVREAKKISSAAFSPDGKSLALGGPRITILNLATGEETSQKFGGAIRAYSADGRYLMTQTEIWDLVAERASTFSLGTFVQATLSLDRRYIATIGSVPDSSTTIARVWDSYTGWEVAQMRHPEAVSAVAFSPDGTRLATLGRGGKIRVWEAASRQNQFLLPYRSSPTLSSSGDAVAAIVDADSSTSAAAVWRFADLQRSDFFVQRRLTSVRFRPGGQAVALEAASDGQSVSLWGIANGQRLISFKLPTQAVFLNDNARFLACLDNLRVAVWDVDTRREIASFPHTEMVQAWAFSADGTLLATASGNHKDGVASQVRFQVWDVLRNSAVGEAIPFGAADERLVPVKVLRLSEGGRYLAAAEIDTIPVWETRTGRLVTRIQGEGNISAVAFSPDEKFIVIGSGKGQGAVSIHSMADYTQIARMRLEPGPPVFLSFSPDHKYLMTGVKGAIGILRRWLWRPEDLIEEACVSLRGQLTNRALGKFLPNEDNAKPCPNLE